MKSASRRESQFFRFLRRLKADGRSNMYGAIPYLMSAFGLDRQAAFGIVCQWLDQQAPAEEPTVPSPRRRKGSRKRAA